MLSAGPRRRAFWPARDSMSCLAWFSKPWHGDPGFSLGSSRLILSVEPINNLALEIIREHTVSTRGYRTQQFDCVQCKSCGVYRGATGFPLSMERTHQSQTSFVRKCAGVNSGIESGIGFRHRFRCSYRAKSYSSYAVRYTSSHCKHAYIA